MGSSKFHFAFLATFYEAGVLIPLSEGRRNRWWEAAGLLDLIGRLEAGQLPPNAVFGGS